MRLENSPTKITPPPQNSRFAFSSTLKWDRDRMQELKLSKRCRLFAINSCQPLGLKTPCYINVSRAVSSMLNNCRTVTTTRVIIVGEFKTTKTQTRNCPWSRRTSSCYPPPFPKNFRLCYPPPHDISSGLQKTIAERKRYESTPSADCHSSTG